MYSWMDMDLSLYKHTHFLLWTFVFKELLFPRGTWFQLHWKEGEVISQWVPDFITNEKWFSLVAHCKIVLQGVPFSDPMKLLCVLSYLLFWNKICCDYWSFPESEFGLGFLIMFQQYETISVLFTVQSMFRFLSDFIPLMQCNELEAIFFRRNNFSLFLVW